MAPFRLLHGFEIDGLIPTMTTTFENCSLNLTYSLGLGELIHGLRNRLIPLLSF